MRNQKKNASVSSTKKRNDIWLLLVWTALTSFLALAVFRAKGAYVSTFFYFVVPTTYLMWNYKLNLRKVLAGSFLIGILISLSLDILINFNGSWFVPTDQLLMKVRLFGFYPIDEILWFFFVALYTIVFYEIFVDDERVRRLSRNFMPAATAWLYAVLATIVATVFFNGPHVAHYSYFVIAGPFTLVPILYVLYAKPRLLKKFLMPTLFFFFVGLNFEVVALTLHNWEFHSDYLAFVPVFGQMIPVEEFVYWIVLYPMTCLSYYELLVDDGK